MITDQPALVSTSAAVAPAGPVPMMTASQSCGSVTSADLVVGVAARLYVAVPTNDLPTGEITIAAVLGRAVRAFARVRVQRVAQLSHAAQSSVFVVAVEPA